MSQTIKEKTKIFDFTDFTIYNNGDLKGCVVGVIHFKNTDREHEFLYRIDDTENGNINKLVTIDYCYENPVIAEQWEVIERAIYNKINSYFKCTCGKEMFHAFPINALLCNCGATVNRLQYVSDEQATQIKSEW